MLGIIIGVGSIITVVAIGQGGEASLKSQFVGDGNNVISIHYSSNINDPFSMETNEQPHLTEEGIFEIKNTGDCSSCNDKRKMEALDIEEKRDGKNHGDRY